MAFTDRSLTCADCGAPFNFSADDQAHHAEEGFTDEPKRCPDGRSQRSASGGDRVREGRRW